MNKRVLMIIAAALAVLLLGMIALLVVPMLGGRSPDETGDDVETTTEVITTTEEETTTEATTRPPINVPVQLHDGVALGNAVVGGDYVFTATWATTPQYFYGISFAFRGLDEQGNGLVDNVLLRADINDIRNSTEIILPRQFSGRTLNPRIVGVTDRGLILAASLGFWTDDPDEVNFVARTWFLPHGQDELRIVLDHAFDPWLNAASNTLLFFSGDGNRELHGLNLRTNSMQRLRSTYPYEWFDFTHWLNLTDGGVIYDFWGTNDDSEVMHIDAQNRTSMRRFGALDVDLPLGNVPHEEIQHDGRRLWQAGPFMFYDEFYEGDGDGGFTIFTLDGQNEIWRGGFGHNNGHGVRRLGEFYMIANGFYYGSRNLSFEALFCPATQTLLTPERD
ncbi:MAG: hypothetical protein FWD06_00785 [Oscillospiraceae bacterium]|nr:hypothetical protein [Oscillospiraceae bacterium]